MSILSAPSLASSVLAAPTKEARAAGYRLQISAPGSHFDKSYLESYHTGAGLNDVVLSSSTGPTFTTNGESIQSTLGVTESDAPVYGLDLTSDFGEDSWYPVTLNVGGGQKVFTFENGNLVANSTDTAFAGWLACNWAHDDQPQLFYLVEPNPKFPSSCAKATIHKA